MLTARWLYAKEILNENDWHQISCSGQVASDAIIEFADKLEWYYLLQLQKVNEKVLEKFIDRFDKINWENISKYQVLSEKFIEKYKSKLSMRLIYRYQKFSNEYIENNKDKINWDEFSVNLHLTESLIRKYDSYINWKQLTQYLDEKYSCKFYKDYKDKINLVYIRKYKYKLFAHLQTINVI